MHGPLPAAYSTHQRFSIAFILVFGSYLADLPFGVTHD
jgi:hypothetical protein